MSDKSQQHQETEGSPQLTQKPVIEGQAPVMEGASPTVAAQRAMTKPRSALGPADIRSLQQTVGNQAVQRMVGSVQPDTVAPGTVQRHISQGTLGMVGGAHSQGAAAVKEQYSGYKSAKTGLESVRKGGSAMVKAFNALLGAMRAAQADPVQSPQATGSTAGTGGGGSTQIGQGGGSGGGESAEADQGEEIQM